jgi:uncharacterized protein YggT (Ycf19 family)
MVPVPIVIPVNSGAVGFIPKPTPLPLKIFLILVIIILALIISEAIEEFVNCDDLSVFGKIIYYLTTWPSKIFKAIMLKS